MDTNLTDPVAIAASELTTTHTGQHRCTNGHYYGAGDWTSCPTNAAVNLLVDTVTDTRQAPHTAVHDPDVIDLVAGAMLSGPMHELDPEQQDAWRGLARLGLEEFCRLLDALRADGL